MKCSKIDILEQYEKSGNIMYMATLSGDYKTNNVEGKKLTKLFKYLEADKKFAWDCIKDMLKSENVVIQTEAASYCLALGVNVNDAEKKLMDISSKEENGIFGFNAKMILDVWRKQGYLEIY